jgi:hypothetical protein
LVANRDRKAPSALRERVLAWSMRVIAAGTLVVVAWIVITAFPMLVHGQPTYVVLLFVTTVAAVLGSVFAWRTRAFTPRRRQTPRTIGLVAAIVWVVLIGWLAPSVASQTAVAAMASGPGVSVTETSSEIVLTPTGAVDATGLFFQPGAKVDARAYVAVLRPVAAAGHVVIIPKQPLGIAFLSIGAFDSSRHRFGSVKNWVVGGHSLGGTVASITANSDCGARDEPVVGLLLFASYPATDISTSLKCPVLSISASNDGLATPGQIQSTKHLLPASTEYVQIHGAVHAFFGDYGTQSGDGQPTITHAAARARISTLAVAFMAKFTSQA